MPILTSCFSADVGGARRSLTSAVRPTGLFLVLFGLTLLRASPSYAQALPRPAAVTWPNSGGTLKATGNSPGAFKGQPVPGTMSTSGALGGDKTALLASANVNFGPYSISLSNTGFSPINFGAITETFTITVRGSAPGQVASSSPLTLVTLGQASQTLTAGLGKTVLGSITVPVVMPSVFMDIEVVAQFSPAPYGRPDSSQFPTTIIYPSIPTDPNARCGRVTPGLLTDTDNCMRGAINPTGLLVPDVLPLSIVYEPPGNCSFSNLKFSASVGSAVSVTQTNSTATNTLWNYSALGGILSDSSNTTQTITTPTSSTSAFSTTTAEAFGTEFGLPDENPGNPWCNAGMPAGDRSSTNGPGLGDQFVFVVQPSILYWDTAGLTTFRLSTQQAPGAVETLAAAYVDQIDPNHPELRPSFMQRMTASQLQSIRGLDPFAATLPTAMPLPPPDDPVATSSGAPLSPLRYIPLARRCIGANSASETHQGTTYDSSTQAAIVNGYQKIASSSGNMAARNNGLVVGAFAGLLTVAGGGGGQAAFSNFGKATSIWDSYILKDTTTTTVTENISTNRSFLNAQTNSYAQTLFLRDQNREVAVDLYYDTFFGSIAFNPVTSCGAPRTGGWDVDWGAPDARWFADVNGDGYSDYCRVAAGLLSCSLGTRGGVMRGTPDWTQSIADLGWPGRRWFVDVNGDGKADFCRAVGNPVGGDQIGCSFSSGGGVSAGFDILSRVSDWGYDDRRWLVDVTGDGRADLCRAVGTVGGAGSYMGCSFSRGTSFSTTFDILSPVSDWGYSDRRFFVDINRDNKADLCRAMGDTAGPNSYLGCSITTESSIGGVTTFSPVSDWGYADRRYMMDVNGDGRADFCRAIGDSYGPNSFMGCLLMGDSAALAGSTQTQLQDWGFADRRWLAKTAGHGEYCRAVGNTVAPGSWLSCQVF
jgi:hypothetical protein